MTLEEVEQFFSLSFDDWFSNFITMMNLFQMRRMMWERGMHLWPLLNIV